MTTHTAMRASCHPIASLRAMQKLGRENEQHNLSHFTKFWQFLGSHVLGVRNHPTFAHQFSNKANLQTSGKVQLILFSDLQGWHLGRKNRKNTGKT